MSNYEPEEYDVPKGYANVRCVICNMKPFNETENFEDFCECINPRYGDHTEIIKPDSKEFSELWPVLNAKSIAKDIVALTERLDSQEELKDSWRVINLALQYLSSKDSMFTYEKEIKEKIGGD